MLPVRKNVQLDKMHSPYWPQNQSQIVSCVTLWSIRSHCVFLFTACLQQLSYFFKFSLNQHAVVWANSIHQLGQAIACFKLLISKRINQHSLL